MNWKQRIKNLLEKQGVKDYNFAYAGCSRTLFYDGKALGGTSYKDIYLRLLMQYYDR